MQEHGAREAALPDLNGARVAFLVDRGPGWIATLWGIWRAGGVAVPLSAKHVAREINHLLHDAGCTILISPPGQVLGAAGEVRLEPIVDPPAPFRENPAIFPADPHVESSRAALILYTSGTTGHPKGAVHTHAGLQAQCHSLTEAWQWSSSDRILHVLPLHHTHGIVNALLCALHVGASIEFATFDPVRVWNRLASRDITVFMGVPTMYAQLLRAWRHASPERQEAWSKSARTLRLAVSGSAALPVSVFNEWEQITGCRLLERYGMTEIGMGLSNPYAGSRRAGTVGQPLPSVEVRLVSPDSGRVLAEDLRVHCPGESGEIQIRGPMVMREYWNRPEETRASFSDGWFRTGDEGSVEDGYYRILGRRSVDILKSGGFKISAVEIEETLRGHELVGDCAVVGLPDPEWGELVAAAVQLASPVNPSAPLNPPSDAIEPTTAAVTESGGPSDAVALEVGLQRWLRERLSSYKVPRRWLILRDLPRNSMGKVIKPHVLRLLEKHGVAL